MKSAQIQPDQGMALVKLARQTLAEALYIPWEMADETLFADPIFGREQATFVTLKIRGELRGCIGTLQPVSPLVESIRKNTFSAAFNDTRFPSISAGEFDEVSIEISLLSPVEPLYADSPEAILAGLRTGLDGVVLVQEAASSTFLPQVWQHLPNPEHFLRQLSLKAGLPGDAWRDPQTKLFTYQVQHFEEPCF
ncbi:MAG: AmmeMemoRadiSam system protein A [Desulfobacterales bacterium]|nr:AmmeMemoRadiSam system protein A [Desulfobacterales bacterium]